MLKKVTFSVCSMLLLTTLAACGGQKSPNSNASGSSQTVIQTQNNQSKSKTSNTNSPKEKPVAPETHPVGDIPDSQAFINYESSQNGFSLVVPEGWARSTQANTVQFVSKLDGVSVTSEPTFASKLSVDNVKSNWIPKLKSTERAVKVESLTKVKLPVGEAIRVVYNSNSEPNSVTGKQVRLEDNAYLFQKGNKLAIISLWAPYGADNVDQWRKMSESFGWK